MPLPNDRDERNALPVWDGCIAYFPDAWAEIAKVSVLGNKQHALGAKLCFARDVSTDHANKVMRHMLDHAAGAVMDSDGTRHLAKAAWRILAALQVSIEAETGVIAPTAVNSADLSKSDGKCPWCKRSKGHHRPECRALEEEANGQTDCQDPQRNTGQGIRPAGTQISDRGRKPRPERPFPSQPERDFSPESGGEGKGSQ